MIIDGNIDAIKLQFTTPTLIDLITIGKTFASPASQAQIEAGQIQQVILSSFII